MSNMKPMPATTSNAAAQRMDFISKKNPEILSINTLDSSQEQIPTVSRALSPQNQNFLDKQRIKSAHSIGATYSKARAQ